MPVPDKKSTYLSIYFLAIPLGFALGFLFGGFIENYINWHYAFLIESIIVLFLSFIVLCWKDYLHTLNITKTDDIQSDYGTDELEENLFMIILQHLFQQHFMLISF